MTPLEELQAAGFSDKEIGGWAGEQRGRLHQAGFAEEEIDHYLAGPKEALPPAIFQRSQQSEKALAGLRSVGMTIAAGGAGMLLDFITDPLSPLRTLISPELEQLEQSLRPHPGQAGAELAHKLTGVPEFKPQTPAERVGLATAQGAVAGGPFGPLAAAGGALMGLASQTTMEATGGERAATAAGLIAGLVPGGALLARRGGTLTRIEPDPATGGLREVPIGDLPEVTDFTAAAKTIMGTPVPRPPVVEKLRQLWREHGIHPSEVAHDATRDPTIAQDLASSTTELPLAYVGGEPQPRSLISPELEHLASMRPRLVAGESGESGPGRGSPQLNDSVPEVIGEGATPETAGAGRLTTEPDHLDPTRSVAKDATGAVVGEGATPAEALADAAAKPPAAAPDLYFLPDPDAPPAGLSIGAPRRRLTPAEEEVLSHIDVGGRRSRQPLSWASLYTNTVDRLNPIPDRDAAGLRVPTSDNPYRLMRMLSGDPGKSQGWLRLGQVDYATGNKIGPSLQEILAPVQGDLNPLRAFMDSVRALELEGKGIRTGFDPAAIRQVATAGLQEFGPIMARLVEYQNNLLKYMRDAGVLSDQAYTDIVAKHQSYVPFHAVLDEASQRFGGGTLQPNNPLYRLEGSQRVKVDPLESILEHTYQYISMAERNRAATAMVDLLASRGEATPATAATPAERQIRTFEGGTEKLWEVERDIADTVKSLDADAAGFLARWLGSDRAELRTAAQLLTLPARTLRAGATLSPDFLLRNPIRDYFTALLQSEKPLFTPWDQVKGFLSAVMRDEYFRRWLQGGGGNAELVAMDRRYLQEDLRQLNQDTGIMSRGWNVVRHPLDLLRTVSEYSERATRLGEFRYVYDRELRRGATPDEASRTAAYASREVSVDFSRRGAVTQSLNMIDAFWNASVQGTDRFVRQMRDHPYATSLKVAAGITLPSTLLWWANHDDPRWKELPAWQRDLFWIVMTDKWTDMGPAEQADAAPYAHGGTSWRIRGGRYQRNDGAIFRLPKPFEPGIVFGSGVERLLDAYFTDNPDQLAAWSKSIAAAVLPVPGSTLGAPLLEQYANRSLLTDSNLIPQYLEKELPEYQYQPYTTETAKALGQRIAAFPGMREVATGHSQAAGVARALTTPILLENYLRAWTGGGGMYLLQIADAALRRQGLVPDPPRPADTLADIPVVKAFVVRYPSAGSASVQRFYDEFERNQRYFTSWQARAKEGDVEAMQRIQEAGGPRLFVQMDAIKEAMAKQAKVIRDIAKNAQITPDEKRQLIDTLYFGQIEVAAQGVQALRAADRALAPGANRVTGPIGPVAQPPAMTQPIRPPPSPGSLPILQ